MNYCDKQSKEEFFANVNSDGIEVVDDLYRYLVPILFTGCLVGLVLNLILLVVGHVWCRNKSPIFRLSLNLATTDAINSLIVGIGLFVNSYLPRVFGIGISKCSLLVLEIFRLSSLVASALHLLAMALVYYRGTTHPLHYRFSIFYSTHLTRSIYLVSLSCWLLPIIIFTIFFSSISCQGFQSDDCDVTFLLSFKFRITITGLFLTPLLVMSVLYAQIFRVIRSREKITHNKRRPTILLEMVNDRQIRHSIQFDSNDTKNNFEIRTAEESSRRTSNAHNGSYPRKAVITTLTILGLTLLLTTNWIRLLANTCRTKIVSEVP